MNQVVVSTQQWPHELDRSGDDVGFATSEPITRMEA
jgi:hypothetical protein